MLLLGAGQHTWLTEPFDDTLSGGGERVAQQVQAGLSSAPVSAVLTVNAEITCTVWGGSPSY